MRPTMKREVSPADPQLAVPERTPPATPRHADGPSDAAASTMMNPARTSTPAATHRIATRRPNRTGAV